MAKKQKSDLKSHSSYSLGCIEYLNINSLWFNDVKRGVPLRKCPTGVKIVGWIILLTEKYEVSKLLRREGNASIELRDVWILQTNIYPMNHKSIAHKTQRVYEEFLKFNKTHRDKRKQTSYNKEQHCLTTGRRRDSIFQHMTWVKLKS